MEGTMAGGHWQVIGNRKTFIPPFVNERFDGPPYWACTFTALLIGANVGYLGRKPATYDEIRKLARASGDKDLRGGSRSSHMIQAMKLRYGEAMHIEALGARNARERLADGWAMVCAVTYGELPPHYRRHSKNFKGGHRMVVLGMERGGTYLIDPMARQPASWGGEWIKWSDFLGAWWNDEQLWFREGQFVDQWKAVRPPAAPVAPVVKPKPAPAKPKPAAPAGPNLVPRALQKFDEPRPFRVATGTRVKAYRIGPTLQLVRDFTFTHPSRARFDALVAFDTTSTLKDTANVYLHVVDGAFEDRYVPWSTQGLVADSGTAAVVAATEAAVAVASASAAATPTPDDKLARAILDAKREEYDRIAQHLLNPQGMPPPPTA
jgi:hypothetical protein